MLCIIKSTEMWGPFMILVGLLKVGDVEERLLMHIEQSHMPYILQCLFNNVYLLQKEKLYNNDSLPQPALANPLPSQLYRLSLDVSQDSSRSSCQTQRLHLQSCPG